MSCIHLVFHVSLLQSTSSSEIPNRAMDHYHQSSWMTQTSGKSVRSLTAGMITIARGQDCFTLSNGKGLTTPPMPLVGNCLSTLPTHLTWSRHSIRLIQPAP